MAVFQRTNRHRPQAATCSLNNINEKQIIFYLSVYTAGSRVLDKNACIASFLTSRDSCQISVTHTEVSEVLVKQVNLVVIY